MRIIEVTCRKRDKKRVKKALDSFSPARTEGIEVPASAPREPVRLAYSTPGNGHGDFFKEKASSVQGVTGVFEA